MWGYGRQVRKGPSPEPNHAGTLTLDVQPPELWEMNVRCWSLWVCGAFLQQHELTMACPTQLWSYKFISREGFLSCWGGGSPSRHLCTQCVCRWSNPCHPTGEALSPQKATLKTSWLTSRLPLPHWTTAQPTSERPANCYISSSSAPNSTSPSLKLTQWLRVKSNQTHSIASHLGH